MASLSSVATGFSSCSPSRSVTSRRPSGAGHRRGHRPVTPAACSSASSVGVEAEQLGEHLVGVLAEARAGVADRPGRRREAGHDAGHRHLPALGRR